MVSKEGTTTKNKSQSKKFHYNIIFCPFCGAAVDHNLLLVQGNTCIECKKDMTEIIASIRVKKQTKYYCENCSYENPIGVDYCIKCGANEFSEEKKRFRSKYFHKREAIIGIISILIAIGITCGLMFGFATQFLIPQGIIALLIGASFSIVLAAFFYVIILTIVKTISEGH